MGKRSQPRLQVEVPVRIFGTDSRGQVFSEKVLTVNVNWNGVELAGVRSTLNYDEIIGLSYGNNRAHFRVKWVGEPGTPKAGHVGLRSISPEKPLWDFELPADAVDDYQPGAIERRGHSRFRCQNSVEIHVYDGPSFWGVVADLCMGGCYVEMPIPLPAGTRVKVGIWFGQHKVWADALVTHRTPGFGLGLKFITISEQDLGLIREFLEGLTPFAKKGVQTILGAQPQP